MPVETDARARLTGVGGVKRGKTGVVVMVVEVKMEVVVVVVTVLAVSVAKSDRRGASITVATITNAGTKRHGHTRYVLFKAKHVLLNLLFETRLSISLHSRSAANAIPN